ncbi:hypothetical protein BJV74DRAFT_799496 [Russula compacta]|nr:hypothetical protein BJV74DRAFT_799496 [Russula compacta]
MPQRTKEKSQWIIGRGNKVFVVVVSDLRTSLSQRMNRVSKLSKTVVSLAHTSLRKLPLYLHHGKHFPQYGQDDRLGFITAMFCIFSFNPARGLYTDEDTFTSNSGLVTCGHSSSRNHTSMKAGAICRFALEEYGIYDLMAFEEKDEVGTGRLMQPIRNPCCPTLIALAGPRICILRAVFVERMVVQELTDFIWIGGHPCNDDKVKSVACILAALGERTSELEDLYKNFASS